MKDINELKSEISKRTEDITAEIEQDLKEAAHWFGGFDELRKVIDRLEENANEAAFERCYDTRR